MGWSNYLAETGSDRIDLLLSPLLESRFNACRAPVKTIDAARSGAVGLYSNRPPYRGFVRDGIDGLLLEDDHASWLAAIERLIAAPEERQRLAGAGRARALALSRGEPG
jgi:glycosyltransferase involved in cell wall biosynthesis